MSQSFLLKNDYLQYDVYNQLVFLAILIQLEAINLYRSMHISFILPPVSQYFCSC